MRKPSNKTKIIAIASLTLLIALAIPMINAQTAAITFDPASVAQGDSVTVEGTGFAATSAVGIGLGEEITVTWEAHEIVDVAVDPDDEGVYGPFTGTTLHHPIKPGSFSFHCDVSAVTSDYYDDYSNGTLNTTSTYAVDPFVNYATGEFGRSTWADWSTYIVVFFANYTYYADDVTPDAGVTTDDAGAFTASVTVPNVLGDFAFTAVDDKGNSATSTETLEVVPEGLTFGAMVLLSSVAVLVGSHYLRNRSKKREK